jgi:hypothetical protein
MLALGQEIRNCSHGDADPGATIAIVELVQLVALEVQDV